MQRPVMLIVIMAALVVMLVGGDVPLVRDTIAALPIAAVLVLMVMRRWGGQYAGPAGWLMGLVAASVTFGLTFDVFWVSQLKGLLLSIFVLMVLWPALFLYNVVDQANGIRAIAQALRETITDRGLLLIVVAWAFSGTLEGLAGFGLPVAIAAPMLVALDVSPVTAVAAVAVGHAWSVTFGDMGVIFQTLTGLVDVDEYQLATVSALMLGIACLACGLATARILGEGKRWRPVVGLAVVMSLTQYGLAVTGLIPLAALVAGMVGIVGAILLSRVVRAPADAALTPSHAEVSSAPAPVSATPALAGALLSYGTLTALLAAIALIPPLQDALRQVAWKAAFPEVKTLDGFVTKAGSGQVFRPLVHPGTTILLVALASNMWYRRTGLCDAVSLRQASSATWRSAAPASVGILAMVGLSTLMDHAGMTQILAEAMSDSLDVAYPVVSPLVGMLGAFATGSNNNSNVLFAPLQESVAVLLAIAPRVLVAAQTTGGALGSMIAPAKIVVGCSTVGLHGRDGDVLRITLPYGLLIGLGIGVLALILAAL